MNTEVLSYVTDTDDIRQAKDEGRFVYIGRDFRFRPKGQRNWGLGNLFCLKFVNDVARNTAYYHNETKDLT